MDAERGPLEMTLHLADDVPQAVRQRAPVGIAEDNAVRTGRGRRLGCLEGVGAIRGKAVEEVLRVKKYLRALPFQVGNGIGYERRFSARLMCRASFT